MAFKKAKVPKGQFALVNPDLADQDPRELQPDLEMLGPYDGNRVHYEEDNATVFITEGLPARFGFTKQRGKILTVQDGSKLQIVPWPSTS